MYFCTYFKIITMATYKKKDKTAKQIIKDQAHVSDTQSTTKEVFEGVDSWANRAEAWVLKRQKTLLIGIGAIVVVLLGYFIYLKFVKLPAEKVATDELAFPKANFDEAIAMEEVNDSIFKLALNGSGGKLGFLDIIDQYGNTDAGNMAKYYAGISYLKMSDYKKAIEYLDEFKSKDIMLGPVAKGAIGDAFVDLNKPQEAFKYYTEAYKMSTNIFSTPLFMEKAAQISMELKDYKTALELYTKIKEDYPLSQAALDIDAKINMAKFSN